ncbi:PTS sugar transporter subunit IIA [Virgibacillus kimchii]
MNTIVLNESTISIDLEGNSYKEVLSTMANNLHEKDLVKESFSQAVINREGEFATGLPTSGVSVAIPHTDVEHVHTKTISVATLKEPVEFGIMGGAPEETTPVKVVFMLAMNDSQDQLSLLQQLMQVFQDEETLMTIANEKDKTAMKQLLADKLSLDVEGGEQ